MEIDNISSVLQTRAKLRIFVWRPNYGIDTLINKNSKHTHYMYILSMCIKKNTSIKFLLQEFVIIYILYIKLSTLVHMFTK